MVFAIWAIVNSLALLVFGHIAKRTRVMNILDVLPLGLERVYSALMMIIQFFSLLVNITAIKLAMGMIGITWAWIPFVILSFLAVLLKGFSGTVKGDVTQIIVWISLMSVALVFSNKATVALVPSNFSNVGWVLWGALILLSGPIVDKQMWQRKLSMRNRFSITPYVMATVIFAFYMVLVGLFGISGINIPIVTAIVILCVAGSTLLSALSALTTYGKTIAESKLIITGFLVCAVLAMLLNASVLSIWTLYGSIRIPFAAYLAYRILGKRVTA